MRHTKRRNGHVGGAVGLIAGAAVGLGGIVVHGPGTANADDEKIFGGQFCFALKPNNENGTALFGPGGLEQYSGIDYQEFVCPIVRDIVTGDLDDVWVRVNNENSDEDTPPKCCVHSVSIGGSLHDMECKETPDDEGSMSLHFPLNGFTEFDHGFYVLICELGDEDNLYSYRIRESS